MKEKVTITKYFYSMDQALEFLDDLSYEYANATIIAYPVQYHDGFFTFEVSED